MKTYLHAPIVLALAIAMISSCMSATNEKMTVLKQIRLSPSHSVMPYRIIRASNGDFIVSGSTDPFDFNLWATRVSPSGEVRWEFVEGGPAGWKDRSARGQKFNEAIELPDKTTLLCGVKIVDRRRLVLLVHLNVDGSLIAERLIGPEYEGRHIGPVTCFQWGHDIALIGGLYGGTASTGWLARLDEKLNVKWERLGDQYATTRVMGATAGGFFVINTALRNPDGSNTSVIKMGPNGEVIARREFSDDDNPELVHPAVQRAGLTIALVQSTLKTEIVYLDDQLHTKHGIQLHNAGVKKALELPDGSITIFGSQFQGVATAAVTRVDNSGGSKGFLSEPENQSAWYYDAEYLGNLNEFAAVRSVEDLKAVLELISFD